jgi:hypothetical protein
MKTTMVNALKNIFSPPPAGRNGKLTKRSTQWHHQAYEAKRGLEAVRVSAVGALRSFRSKMELVEETQRETHFLSNEENEKWIEDYFERETAVVRKRVEDAETAVHQQQDDMTHAEIAGLTSKEPEKKFEEMLVPIGDSLSDLASSDDGVDGEDQDDEETEQGKLSEDDEPSWVIGTITKMVLRRKERFSQKQMKLDELTQPGLEHEANSFRERDKMYSTYQSRVLAFVQP